MATLFSDYTLAGHPLKNRAVMAPMTRARAPGNIPDAATARYYAQRTDAALIVTEGTPISREGNGFVNCPGIWSEEQIAGWRQVTQQVHDGGSLIFTQIWHVGRISHTSLQPNGRSPVSATSVQASKSSAFAYQEDGTPGFVTASKPHALSTEEVRRVVDDFARAARNAAEAGFDGVEIHGANGYLIEQFLNGAVNDRQDCYGSDTLENRLRFALEVVDACIEATAASRVGIRLSPFGRLHELGDFEEEEETFLALAEALSKRNIAYVHIMDQASRGAPAMPEGFLEKFRQVYSGTLILAGGMELEKANKMIEQGLIDLAAFGANYISNPDLVERYRHGWPVVEPDPQHYYGGDEHGYTDYPAYSLATHSKTPS